MPETPPQPAGGDSPQQAPMGVSSVTGPTPNKGYEAAVIQGLGVVVNKLTEMLPMVGATSEMGQAIMKSISSLAKHVPSGASNPASEKNVLERDLQRNQQNMQATQQMRSPQQPGAQQPPGGPPGMARAA
jgi:hypothetical protein